MKYAIRTLIAQLENDPERSPWSRAVVDLPDNAVGMSLTYEEKQVQTKTPRFDDKGKLIEPGVMEFRVEYKVMYLEPIE